MTRIIFIVLTLFVLAIAHQPAIAQTQFASHTTLPESKETPDITVLHFNASLHSDRVILFWTLDKNQSVDQIQVEKSKDDKIFTVTGLVFGTDQPEKAEYLFYEKNKGAKFYYRLKIIKKDRTVTYSPVVIPETDVNDKP